MLARTGSVKAGSDFGAARGGFSSSARRVAVGNGGQARPP